MPRINYELPEETHRRAKIAAAIEGVTVHEIVIRALDKYADDVIKREAGNL